MKVQLRKNVKTDSGETLSKSTEGVLIAVSWSDTYSERYYVEIKGKRYMIDKPDADLY